MLTTRFGGTEPLRAIAVRQRSRIDNFLSHSAWRTQLGFGCRRESQRRPGGMGSTYRSVDREWHQPD